jgi:hypothetical protein
MTAIFASSMRLTLRVDQPSSSATASRLMPLASRNRRSAAPSRRRRIVGTETMAPDNAIATSSQDSDDRVTQTGTPAVQLVVSKDRSVVLRGPGTPPSTATQPPDPALPPEPRAITNSHNGAWHSIADLICTCMSTVRTSVHDTLNAIAVAFLASFCGV